MDVIADRQDYFWFLVILGWAMSGLGWLWSRDRTSASEVWIPACAIAGVVTGVLHWAQLLVPVPVGRVEPPWGRWDLASGLVAAGLAAALVVGEAGRRRGRRARGLCLLIAAAAIGAGVVRVAHPVVGGMAIATITTGAAWCLGWRSECSGPGRAALVGVALIGWLGVGGGIGAGEGLVRSDTERVMHAAALAALHLVTCGCAVVAVARRVAGRLQFSAGHRREGLGALGWWILGWIVSGAVLAEAASVGARLDFEKGLVHRVTMASALIDRDLLAHALGPQFHIRETFRFGNGVTEPFGVAARSAWLGSGVVDPISGRLALIESANPDVLWAYVTTLRSGWLVGVAYSSAIPGSAAHVPLLREVTEDDREAWTRPQPALRRPEQFFYGRMLQAVAPLQHANGDMLGWLVFDASVARWVAAQIRARVQAFVVVGLGGVLILLSWWQRQRAAQRISAEQRAAVAVAANEAKTAFLAKVSHELRTPIQSVLGYAELLQGARLDLRHAEYLRSLRQHGELMVRLVNDLLDLGALEMGAFRLKEAPVALTELVKQCVESARPAADRKGLALSFEADARVPVWVLADAERIRQVVSNLVGNAVKFTAQGFVRTRLVLAADESVRFIVCDSGPGIAQQDVARLFRPFSRLENAGTTEGSGLGLALSAALCRSLGGFLAVCGNESSGACFEAVWRLRISGPPAQGGEPCECSATLAGRRVLVIDDNALVRELFSAALTERGARVATAGDARTGLERVRAERFDACVLDVGLPGMSGLEVAAVMRAEQPGLRMVGVSAHAAAGDQARALDAGMHEFLVKPVSLGALARAVGGAGSEGSGRETRGDERLRARLARRFRVGAQGHYDAIRAAVQSGDWQLLRREAHALANSASVVGDLRLLAAATELESSACASDPRRAAAHAWPACEEAMRQWLVPES